MNISEQILPMIKERQKEIAKYEKKIKDLEEEIEFIKTNPYASAKLIDLIEPLKDYALLKAVKVLANGPGNHIPILTIADLTSKTEDELMNIKYIGVKYVDKLKEFLKLYGLKLKE